MMNQMSLIEGDLIVVEYRFSFCLNNEIIFIDLSLKFASGSRLCKVQAHVHRFLSRHQPKCHVGGFIIQLMS